MSSSASTPIGLEGVEHLDRGRVELFLVGEAADARDELVELGAPGQVKGGSALAGLAAAAIGPRRRASRISGSIAQGDPTTELPIARSGVTTRAEGVPGIRYARVTSQFS